jgi:hypothetical protein
MRRKKYLLSFYRIRFLSIIFPFTLILFLTFLLASAQVINPQISLSSFPDPAGITINLNGTGFSKGGTVTVFLKSQDGLQSPLKTIEVSPDGSFNVTHLFPTEHPPGTFLLWAIDSITGGYSNAIEFTLPVTQSYTPKHGDLIRAKGDSRIYFVQGQQQYGQPLGYQRRAIANEQIFNQMGFKWSDVKEVDYQDLIVLPEGKPIWSKEIMAPFPEGTLIRLRGTTRTYVIKDGRKCYIPDPETFQSMGYQWDQVMEVDKPTLDSILTGIPLPSVKPTFQYGKPAQPPPYSSTPTPYSQPPSTQPPSTWQPSPYGSSTVPPTTWPTPYQPQSSSPIFPNGTLIKGSGPDIYLIENGVKRLIPDMETFNAMGFNWNNVINVDDQRLGSMPLGSPLPFKKFLRR